MTRIADQVFDGEQYLVLWVMRDPSHQRPDRYLGLRLAENASGKREGRYMAHRVGIVIAAVGLLMALAVTALAAPPNTRPNARFGGGAATEDVHVDVNWQAPDEHLSIGISWNAMGCDAFGGLPFTNVDGLVDASGTLVEGSCGEIDVDLTIAYSGRWSPYHEHFQGQQCKGKILRTETAQYTLTIEGNVVLVQSGNFESITGYCNDTGKPGNPHDV